MDGENPAPPPKICKIMAFKAVIMGLGQLFYILLGLGSSDFPECVAEGFPF